MTNGAKTENKAEGVEKLLPLSRTVTVNGEKITITNFNFMEFLQIKKSMNSVIQALFFVFKNAESEDQVRKNILEIEGEIYQAMSGKEEEIAHLLSLAAKKPREWVGTIDPIEGAELFKAVLSVNADFFRLSLTSKH